MTGESLTIDEHRELADELRGMHERGNALAADLDGRAGVLSREIERVARASDALHALRQALAGILRRTDPAAPDVYFGKTGTSATTTGAPL